MARRERNEEQPSNGQVHVDLVRDEILTTRSTIDIEVPAAADPELVPRAIGVQGVDGRLRGQRTKGRYRWTADEALPPGRHRLVVEALTDGEAQQISDGVEVPFTVVVTAAEIPDRLRIESFARVRVGPDGSDRLPVDCIPEGDFVDFVKAVDRRKGQPVALAFDRDGNEVDGEAMLEEIQRDRLAKLGKVHPTLDEAVRGAKRNEPLIVDMWIDVDEGEPTAGDRPVRDCDVEEAERRAEELGQRRRDELERMAANLSDEFHVLQIDRAAPVITLEVPAPAVKELARRDDVAALFLHETEAILDLEDSIAIANSDSVHNAGETGSGIRAAVWEDGPKDTADLVIAGAFTSSPSTTLHSQHVHAIIRNRETGQPNGHAPGVSLYSANTTARAALTWAVRDQNCTVVNQSFHRSSEPGSGQLSSDDLYGDWLALHWPFPLIVHAAGNFWNGDPDNISPPSSEFVNHKGYNTISVGNHNDDADAMSTSSVFRNPTTSHGDRELPEIAGNGVTVTADGITMSGTSQASPAVAGVASLIQGTSATLAHWPEGCRAILAASASRNVRDNTWWADVSLGVDARDGTGAVDALEARQVALSRRWRNAPATRRGWDVGLLSSSDFGSDRMSTFDYKVAVPGWWFGPRKVKVALAWTSKVGRILGLFYTSHLAVDLDLKVFDSNGLQVGYSGSWDNSYEIAEFVGKPGETYTIRIRRWSGTESTWYGLAWTVTGGFSLRIPLEEVVLRRALANG